MGVHPELMFPSLMKLMNTFQPFVYIVGEFTLNLPLDVFSSLKLYFRVPFLQIPVQELNAYWLVNLKVTFTTYLYKYGINYTHITVHTVV